MRTEVVLLELKLFKDAVVLYSFNYKPVFIFFFFFFLTEIEEGQFKFKGEPTFNIDPFKLISFT